MRAQRRNRSNLRHVRGWILDLYPSALGLMDVWVITENGERIQLVDEFNPELYVYGKKEYIEELLTHFLENAHTPTISCNLASRYVNPTDTEKSVVLRIVSRDCRSLPFLVRKILEAGSYLHYEVYDCDLQCTQAYLFSNDVFPLAFTEIEVEKHRLKYHLLDSVESVDYQVPQLKIMKMEIDISKKKKIASFDDSLNNITISQNDRITIIDSGDEKKKLLRFIDMVKKLDPDILMTHGGDSQVFPYLFERAQANGILDRFVLSRESMPFVARQRRGTTYFSYGKTYYRAPMRRLYGRIHIDENNTFILKECGLEGLFEIARTCRVPLHQASRSSIGSSMSSLQLYQAKKANILIPRNKRIPEVFKSAYELLVGDRGGFVYEPKIGIHDCVGEVDFSSMYPFLMATNNISAETVLCKCCSESKLRIPELDYHLCEKRVGIVPEALKLIITKRMRYKKLHRETADSKLKECYEHRQTALKWILVTCFGYLGYKNSKFGTVDGHIGVCAFGRQAFLKAAHTVEQKGFSIIHGIVDSLWLKKKGAKTQEYISLCRKVSESVGVPLNFEGQYKWVVFFPSKKHSNIPVLNRYFGVKENGKIKVRGLEVRRRDTPKFVHDAQIEMIKVLSTCNDSKTFIKKIPDALKVVKKYKESLLDGNVPIWNLIVTKRLSKEIENYRHGVSQVLAAKQLSKEKVKVSAGKSIRFLFTNSKNRVYDRRVKAEELIENQTKPDVRKYLSLLYSAASNLLSPFGYSPVDVYNSTIGIQREKITSFTTNQHL